MDRYLRDWAVALMPSHSNQHACQAGKSMIMSIHHLMVWVEKVLNKQDVFLDIEGAFNYTSFYSMCDALVSLSYTGLATALSDGLELPWRAT